MSHCFQSRPTSQRRKLRDWNMKDEYKLARKYLQRKENSWKAEAIVWQRLKKIMAYLGQSELDWNKVYEHSFKNIKYWMPQCTILCALWSVMTPYNIYSINRYLLSSYQDPYIVLVTVVIVTHKKSCPLTKKVHTECPLWGRNPKCQVGQSHGSHLGWNIWITWRDFKNFSGEFPSWFIGNEPN